METPTRYDLNAAIENWRAELAAQPNLTAEVRRELETHLRDAIAGFQQCGLNDEESFWLACKRVGQPPQLGEEYAKANPGEVWRDRIFWMLFGNFIFFVWGFLSSSVAMKFISPKGDIPTWVDSITNLASATLPLIIGVLLAKGKLLRQASAIGWFLTNRRRFAITAIILSGVASAFMALSTIETIQKLHISNNVAL